MDEMLDEIEAEAKRKGMSLAALSRAATGNPSAFKNLKASREKTTRRNTVQILKSFADVLDLEFYLGKRRPVYDASKPDAHLKMATRKEVRREFQSDVWILSESADNPADPPRIGLPRDWMTNRGILNPTAQLMTIDDCSMAPTLPVGAVAIVDTGDIDVAAAQGKLFAVRFDSSTLIRRCDLTAYELFARADNPSYPTHSVPKKHLARAPVIGRVRAIFSEID